MRVLRFLPRALLGLSALATALILPVSHDTPVEAEGVCTGDVCMAWVAEYDGAGDGDWAKAVALDSAGNSYATGISIKSPPGSSNGYDIATVKYDLAGNEVWTARYGADGVADVATDIAVGDDGVYVGGQNGDDEALVIKYSLDGAELWAGTHQVTSAISSWLRKLAVDGSGNVYGVGVTIYDEILPDGAKDHDVLVVSWGTDGSLRWADTYEGPEALVDSGHDIAVGIQGSVYVAADSETQPGVGGTGYEIATIRYTSSGAREWVERTPGRLELGEHINVTTDGYVYVAGTEVHAVGPETYGDYKAIKYDAQGNEQWVAHFDGGNSDETVAASAVNSSGQLYITGQRCPIVPPATCFPSTMDWLTVAVSSDGAVLWDELHDGPANGEDEPCCAVADDTGVYIGGELASACSDYGIVKYDPSGTPLWEARYSPGGYGSVGGLAGSNDELVLVGGVGDYVTMRFSAHPASVPPGDDDCDGYFTDVEEFMGTLPLVACPSTYDENDEDPDAWPPDFNDDRWIDILDVVQLTPPTFNSTPPNPNYSQRKDLNADLAINILDIVRLTPPMFNTSCTP